MIIEQRRCCPKRCFVVVFSAFSKLVNHTDWVLIASGSNNLWSTCGFMLACSRTEGTWVQKDIRSSNVFSFTDFIIDGVKYLCTHICWCLITSPILFHSLYINVKSLIPTLFNSRLDDETLTSIWVNILSYKPFSVTLKYARVFAVLTGGQHPEPRGHTPLL